MAEAEEQLLVQACEEACLQMASHLETASALDFVVNSMANLARQ